MQFVLRVQQFIIYHKMATDLLYLVHDREI